MLKALLFDLDNTLIDRNTAFGSVVREDFQNENDRDEILTADAGGYGDRERLFRVWKQRSGLRMTQAVLGGRIATYIFPDKELLQALANLSGKYKLGVITNGGSETQRAKFHAAGLAGVIRKDFVWVSEEVGFQKPDPALFMLACKQLGESASDCLFIGDSETHDGLGARQAGMHFQKVQRPLIAADLEKLALQIIDHGL